MRRAVTSAAYFCQHPLMAVYYHHHQPVSCHLVTVKVVFLMLADEPTQLRLDTFGEGPGRL